jgi:hypothetical protein
MQSKSPLVPVLTALLALAAVLTAAPGLAGDLEFPGTTQADARGDFEVVIVARNTDNPMFTLTDADNVVIPDQMVTRVAPRTWVIRLRGRLVNVRRNGSFTFRADPKGELVDGRVEVQAPLIDVRWVHGHLVVSKKLLGAPVTCDFTCSDGTSWTLYGGAHDTPEQCCAVIVKAGCPEGAKPTHASCAGKDCLK